MSSLPYLWNNDEQGKVRKDGVNRCRAVGRADGARDGGRIATGVLKSQLQIVYSPQFQITGQQDIRLAE
jgi:hypothetical protein